MLARHAATSDKKRSVIATSGRCGMRFARPFARRWLKSGSVVEPSQRGTAESGMLPRFDCRAGQGQGDARSENAPAKPGKEMRFREPHREGVANRSNPQLCACGGNVAGEALAGIQDGNRLSFRNLCFGVLIVKSADAWSTTHNGRGKGPLRSSHSVTNDVRSWLEAASRVVVPVLNGSAIARLRIIGATI